MDLFEYGKYGTAPENITSGLKEYLNNIWLNRTNQYPETKSEENIAEDENRDEQSRTQRFLKVERDQIQALNYVGFIQYEGQQINIWPKVFRESEKPDRKMMLSNLFFWLSYCKRVNFPFSKINTKEFDFEDLLEALVHVFSQYTLELMLSQPYHCYEEVSEDTLVLRGKIKMKPYINWHLVTGNWHKLHCTYEPFLYDNLFNRIVKRVCTILLQSSKNALNRSALSEILFVLDEVADQSCSVTDCDKVKFNRLYEELEVILEMCRMFLANVTPSYEKELKQNFCFLLPMELVFEDFLYGFIKRHFPHRRPEFQKSDMFLTEEGIFRMQHDIFLNNPSLIIDAKYKLRKINRSDRKMGISQSDMYQQLSYAFRRGVSNVMLMYPDYNNNSMRAQYTIRGKNQIEEIRIRAVNLKISNEDHKALEQDLIEQLKVALD